MHAHALLTPKYQWNESHVRMLKKSNLALFQYTDCTCLAAGIGEGNNATVQSAGCRESCDILYPFLVLLFLLIGFNMIAVAPGDAIQLRYLIFLQVEHLDWNIL